MPVSLVRLSWENPTAGEGEYRHLASSTQQEQPLTGGPDRPEPFYDRVVGTLIASGPPHGFDPRPEAAPAADRGAPGLARGRELSRWAGLMAVAVGAIWMHAVFSRGNVGRLGELFLADPGAERPRPGPFPPLLAASLALLGLGLCLPLIHHATVLGPAVPAGAALLAATAAAWHAAAGGPGRRFGAAAAIAALVLAALSWLLSPRLAPTLVTLTLWLAAAGALRLAGERDPHRRFRHAFSAGLVALSVLGLAVVCHFSGLLPAASDLLPDPALSPFAVDRLSGAIALFQERLGWIALASPLAFAVAVWIRPAAGILLGMLTLATFFALAGLAGSSEADMLPVFGFTLLAWSVALAAVLTRLSLLTARFFQAFAERVGFFRHAAVAGVVASVLLWSGGVAWGAYRSPGFYLTAAVLDGGTQRGPYGRTDWNLARADLEAAMQPGDSIATSAPAAARFHLGRADLLLSHERLAGAVAAGGDGPSDATAAVPREGDDGGFAVLDPVLGIPVVASVNGLRSLFRERPQGLLIIDRDAWRSERGVPGAVADEIERRAIRIPLPVRSGLYAFRWASSEPRLPDRDAVNGASNEAATGNRSMGAPAEASAPAPGLIDGF